MLQIILYTRKHLHTWITTAFLAVMLLLCSEKAKAQLMNIQLVVENEFAVSGLRSPDWGLVEPGAGRVALSATNQKAGQFTISATENTHVLLTLETPGELIFTPGSTISIGMESAFVQDGQKDAGLAHPIADNHAIFSLSTGNLILDTNLFQRIQELKTTVFFYGYIYVGDVPPGTYSGNVMVRVEFL